MDAVIVIQEVALHCPKSADVVQAGNFGAIRTFVEYASEEQKEKYLPDLLAGKKILGLGMSEPGAGSAVTELATSAKRVDGGYLINGSKVFSTHSPEAGLFLVYVRFGPGLDGIGSVLVERDAPGLTVGQPNSFMSGEEWSQLYFEDCFVADAGLLLGPGGFKKQISGFNVERIGNSSRALALGRYAFNKAKEYASVKINKETINMKMIQSLAVFMSCVLTLGSSAFAQSAASYPDKPIKIVVSFTAGGTTDILAREVGNQMSIRWKVPVIIENKPGAAGNLGTEIVGRAAPDGYTLLASSIGPISINPTLFGNLPVNPQKALQPVALLGDVPNILAVPSSSGIKNWKEFTAYLKANPGAINYGSTGIGTTAHLISFLFAQKMNMDATHIPYKGAEATRDLVAGRLQFMFATAPSVVPLIKAGQLNAIAVSSKKRISAMPNLPTLNELGVDIATGAWFGFFAPAGTNPAIVKKLNETTLSILEEPNIKQKLLGLGADPVPMNVQEFTKFVRNDYALWAPIVKASGAKPE